MDQPQAAPAAEQLKWSGRTDRGKIRPNNEDAFLGIQFDAGHRSGYWDAMLARHGAQRVETPGYSILVFHLGRSSS